MSTGITPDYVTNQSKFSGPITSRKFELRESRKSFLSGTKKLIVILRMNIPEVTVIAKYFHDPNGTCLVVLISY